MLIDKEHQLAGRLLGPFASKHQHRHVAAKQVLWRIRHLPPTSHAGDWTKEALHA